MKIAIIGAGSYVFTPTVIEDLIIKSKLQDCEIALVDLSMEIPDLLAKIIQRIAADNNVRVNVYATTNRTAALEGADYVINTAAIQGAKRWLMDYEICKDEGIPHECRESGALGGISYSLRTIKLMMEICHDMERLCPRAKLMNVANPLTKVHEAINRYTKITAYGFCNAAQDGANGYEAIAKMLGRDYNKIDVVTAGLNHFVWIVSINDSETEADLLPEYLDKLQKCALSDNEAKVKWELYQQFGAVLAASTEHSCEFLPYRSDVSYYETPPFHGSPEERAERINEMKLMASGELYYGNVPYFLGASWEHPGLVISAVKNKTPLHLNMLNLPNAGMLPQLPTGAIVEVPAVIIDGKIIPAMGITLPDKVVEVCLNQSLVAGMIAQAAVENDRALIDKIIDTDTAITKKAEAKRAMKRILLAHADILG